jgi:hypothetical protein
MMLERSTQEGFEEQLILSWGAFPARISALQDMEKAWLASEAAYFGRSIAWPKKSSPSSYSLKTSQLSLLEEEAPWFKRLPKWGMIVDGVLYPLQALERGIKEIVGSYWLTPSTMDHLPVREGEALDYVMRRGGTSYRKTAGRLNEQVAYPQMWPTPRANKTGGYSSPGYSPTLEQVVMWPTPDANARGAYKNPDKRNGHHFTLQDAAGSGKLNPTWVEWLMGYPKEWTVLEDWAMQWYLCKRKKRLKS